MRDVEHVVGALGPGEREDPVDEVSRDGGFRRERGHSTQLAYFSQRACLDRFRQLARFDLSLEVDDVIGVVLPELAMNRLELFLEIKLALVLKERPPNLLVELALEAQQLDLARKNVLECVEQLCRRRRFEQCLTHLDAHGQVCGNAVRLTRHAVGALHECDDLVRDAAVQRHVLLEQRQNATHHDVEIYLIVVRLIDLVGDRRAQSAARLRVACDARARQALDENARSAVRLACRLNNSRDHTHAV